jgi:hypothetical protein
VEWDGLGEPYTVLGRAGRKEALGRATGTQNISYAPQNPLENALKEAAEDAVIVVSTGRIPDVAFFFSKRLFHGCNLLYF